MLRERGRSIKASETTRCCVGIIGICVWWPTGTGGGAEGRVGAVYYYDANTFLTRPTIDVRPSGSMLNDARLQGISARERQGYENGVIKPAAHCLA